MAMFYALDDINKRTDINDCILFKVDLKWMLAGYIAILPAGGAN